MAPSLLIIGGGFAGANLARQLSSSFNVTLVDKKDYFDITLANVRTSVQSALGEKTTIKYSEIPGLGTFKQGVVTGMTASEVTLQSGEIIKFDYAVLATGSTSSAGVYGQAQATSLEGRRKELKGAEASIKEAKSIVIVGGGPFGIELAAEIVEAFAGKAVTLVHSGERLLEAKAPKLGNFAKKWLEEEGVKVILNDRVERPGDKAEVKASLTTKGGKTLNADLFIWTTGSTPNTGFLRSSGSLASTLDDRGRVKVDAYLRVVGFTNLYALGDINDVPETKLAYLARLQALHTANNIKADAAGSSKLTPWKPANGMDAMFVSLGPGSGVGHLSCCACTGFPVNKMKSEHLFVDQARAELGLKK